MNHKCADYEVRKDGEFAPAATEHSPPRLDPWKIARTLWKRILRVSQRAPRRLRLCESLPLGERRFVAVVEFEQSRFLVGGTSASLVLLGRLENNANGLPSPCVDESAKHPDEPKPRHEEESR